MNERDILPCAPVWLFIRETTAQKAFTAEDRTRKNVAIRKIRHELLCVLCVYDL